MELTPPRKLHSNDKQAQIFRTKDMLQAIYMSVVLYRQLKQ